MPEQLSNKPDIQNLKMISRRTIIFSFGNGVINPFIHIYAAQLGASPTELGWVRAINLTLPNIAQIPWGLAMDRFKKRVFFIFFGGLLYGFLLLPLLFVENVLSFIFFIALSSLFAAMIAPALNSLIGDLCREYNRGRIFANFNAMVSIGSVPATLIAGYVLYVTSKYESVREIYRVPVILGFIFILLSTFISLKIKEKASSEEIFTFKGWIDALKTNDYFRRLCILTSGQGFFMAFAWPSSL
ncbi:MAG: MFS transporter [Candidatus Bathyarchaeia archaeon]